MSAQICSADACSCVFFFNDPATPEIYPLSLHDALPICDADAPVDREDASAADVAEASAPAPVTPPTAEHEPAPRSEEHTSELQSRQYLVCRLLLEKKEHKLLFLTRSSVFRGSQSALSQR